jgi:Tfp pilus assembly protein PilN
MRAVNLLPRQQVQQTSKRPTNVVAIAGAAAGLLVVVVLSAGFLLANKSVDRQRQALTDAKAQLAATSAPKTSAKTNAERATLLSDRERRALALASALSKRVAWDRVLRRVTLVLPSDVWLSSLNGTVPLTPDATVPLPATTAAVVSAIPAAPTALTLEGYTYSQDGVARLLSRLAVVPDLTNVQLVSSKVTPVGSQNVINFTIVSGIRTGKDAA